MIALLLLSRVAIADGLPARPEQSAADVAAAIAAGQCTEGGIDADNPTTLICDGVVLPVVVWAHLELLADDSRLVRALYEREQHRVKVERDALDARIEWLEAELQQRDTPPPVLDRPGVRIAASMAAGAGAVLLGGYALSLLGA